MATFSKDNLSFYYEVYGNPGNPPVMLIAGLGGTGASWKPQINLFAEKYFVIVPDQRGTGQSDRTLDGHSTQQLAADMASLLEHLGLPDVHIVGASTGGAIAQYMALHYPAMVRSLILSSSFARFDPFMKREFEIRRKIAAEWDRHSTLSCFSLFLFSPNFTYKHPEKVAAWIEHAASQPFTSLDREIGLKRIDMIAAHNTYAILNDIHQSTLVLCGDHNFCTPLPLSHEFVDQIPNAELIIFEDAGELIEIEKRDDYFNTVSSFIDRH